MDECPSCGAKVNASDKRCSKCGAKLNKKPALSTKSIIGIVIIAVIIVIVVAFASGVFTSSETKDVSDDSSIETVEPINDDESDNNSEKSSSTEYWASANADKFHLPDCEWAEKISDTNKIIYDSREDAIADGKKPCGVCNP